MNYLAPRFTLKTGEDNTPAGKAGLVAAGARELTADAEQLAQAIKQLAASALASALETQRLQDRDQDARDRITQIGNLLWHWVAAMKSREEDPEVRAASESDVTVKAMNICQNAAWGMAIAELADALGEDMHPANVALELQKRGLA